MAYRVSVLKTDWTPTTVAKHIVMDGFKMQSSHPELIVPSQLPIPMARHCRRRIASALNVHLDREFHSLFDMAVHEIQKVKDV